MPEGQPFPLGRVSLGKKVHDGLTKPEAVAMPSKAFQTHESCSPASVGSGCDVTRTR